MYRQSLWISSLLLAVFAISHPVSAVDYCDSSFCGTTTKHIACNNTGQFLPTCPAGAILVSLTANMRTTLVRAHNLKRNFIAGGNVAKLPAACRMATMQWDYELAKLAALNVRQCKMQHDACRNTVQFKYSGQNLAIMSTTDSAVNHIERLQQAVNMWYSEVKDTTAAHIKKYPVNYSGPDIGHFTVMVAAKNIRLGCAAARYKEGAMNNYLVACNYATTNILDRMIYGGCAKPGAQCKTGMNGNYKNLCKLAEKYPVNAI